MADVNTEVLNAASQATFGLDYPGGLRAATGLDLDPNGICQRLWGKEFNEAFDDMRTILSNHALVVPDVNSYISTPDHADFAMADIDVRFFAAPDAWFSAVTRHFVGQRGSASTASWIYTHHANGRPRLAVYTDGTNPLGAECTAATPYGNNQAGWHRATVDLNNGAGGRTFNYYTSTNGTTWDQLGTADLVEAGTVTLFASTDAMTIPGSPPPLAFSLRWTGRVYYVEIRSAINGTIVANPDFRTATPGASTVVDSTGKTWTLQGSSRIV